MSTFSIGLLASLASLAPLQDSKPTAEDLVAQAWQLMPAYEGDHRAFLSAQLAGEVQAAAHLFEAALALEPEHLRGLWSLGHARVLLAENHRNRGERELAERHHARCLEALGRGLALQPEDPWAAYARGAAQTAFGNYDEALADLQLAIDSSSAAIDTAAAAGQDTSNSEWLRFKAEEWRCESLTRAQLFDEAASALAEFHGLYSNNEFPGLMAAARMNSRARDFASVQASFERNIELFAEDGQSSENLAYVRGLLRDREGATRLLKHAISLERVPGFYTRLWLWILATEEEAEEARADLQLFVDNAPSSTTPWDLRLGRFLLGEGSVPDFVEAGRLEVERRIEADEVVDELPCEVQFYAGVFWRRMAEGIEDFEARRFAQQQAWEHFQKALEFRPIAWKWEWAFSRLAFADLSAVLEVGNESGFELKGRQFEQGDLRVELRDARWCVAGSARPTSNPEHVPSAGDLLMGNWIDQEGRRRPIMRVVGID